MTPQKKLFAFRIEKKYKSVKLENETFVHSPVVNFI